jgi:hypothetical protein
MENWMLALKRAYEAGYYKTEAAPGKQTYFPWQNKTCRDCAFWYHSVCRVHLERRGGMSHTCVHFDDTVHGMAERLLRARHAQETRRRP